MNTETPNILLIVSDQQHANTISALGQQFVNTPNLDRLASEGMSFSNCYCTEPICGPSRASIFSGRMPSECGVYQNGHNIRSNIPNIGQWLHRCGSTYQTVYAGKWHVRQPHTANVPGFDMLASGINCQGQLSDASVSMACEGFLRNRRSREPFFLAAMYTQPHDICEWIHYCCGIEEGRFHIPETDLPPLPDNFRAEYAEPDILAFYRGGRPSSVCKWSEYQWRVYLWGYYRLVEMLDAEIGRILQALDASGQAENTLVIFASDHGEGLAELGMITKNYLYDSAARVPLVIRWPNHVKPGSISKELISLLDIAPTVYDCLDLPIPSGSCGLSLKDFLAAGTPLDREYVSVQGHGGKGQCIRSSRFKYIVFRDDPIELLFDMENDPGETVNLASEPEYQDTLHTHRRYLTGWLAGLDVAPCIPEDHRFVFAAEIPQ